MLSGSEDDPNKEKNGTAWNAVIDVASGKMVVSASGDRVAFAIFGSCVPR